MGRIKGRKEVKKYKFFKIILFLKKGIKLYLEMF